MNLSPEGYFPGAPDFAVEVISPSDTESEVAAKNEDWLQSGCLAVLVLDPASATARLLRPGRAPQSFGSTDVVTVDDLRPGWSLPLREVFR